jgi:hypothetical protein
MARLALIVVSAIAALSSCQPLPRSGFGGAWVFWADADKAGGRFLVIARDGEDYLLRLADPAGHGLEGSGRGCVTADGRRLFATTEEGATLDLALNGAGELRAAMRKQSQSEDLSFVYVRLPGIPFRERQAVVAAAGGRKPGADSVSGLLAPLNDFGGKSILVSDPTDAGTDFTVYDFDGQGRLRRRWAGFPEAALKEDPRTDGIFSYDEAGRLLEVEYRFSRRFAAGHGGLASVTYAFSPEGRTTSREWRYGATAGSAPRSVLDHGGPDEGPDGAADLP